MEVSIPTVNLNGTETPQRWNGSVQWNGKADGNARDDRPGWSEDVIHSAWYACVGHSGARSLTCTRDCMR